MISALLLLTLAPTMAMDVPVPPACTPSVNAKLGSLIAAGTRKPVDNVMVCGVTSEASVTQRAGKHSKHGDHQIISLHATFPGGVHRVIEVVTNDQLDGKIVSKPNVTVFAYGEAFFDRTGTFLAGIHDVHCATHLGADNGWVVVDGQKSPSGTCAALPENAKRKPRRWNPF